MERITVRERQPDPGQQWKCGDEFLPFHPQASHVEPAYRDGWNRCYWMASERFSAVQVDEPKFPEPAITPPSISDIRDRGVENSDGVPGALPLSVDDLMELARQYAHAYFNHHNGSPDEMLVKTQAALRAALAAGVPGTDGRQTV